MLMLLGLLAGIILANQNPVNAFLRTYIGSPSRTSLISFTVGVIFLAIILVCTGVPLLPTGAEMAHTPVWMWLGGGLAAIYLTTFILLFPKIGAIQTAILPILGQVLMGTAIDTFGLFGNKVIQLTGQRILGIIILLFGIFIAVVWANYQRSDKKLSGKQVTKQGGLGLNIWRVWAVIAGVLSAMQQAINGQLGIALSSPVKATFVSFSLSWVVLIFIVLVMDHRIMPKVIEVKNMPWWGWLGGILGALFVLLTVILVPKIGAGLTVTTILVGQLGGSIVVAQWGLWHSPIAPVKRLQIIGILVMLVGVLVIKGII
ncbi:DMT family transporter [Periweissella cryptocerci]|uniref:DMT family transporter n=1 Tax=Periweissella cryptocerci TaxID=2506420 RepID=A0A4P6YXD2_9LACO|nr:DMT family transporter [Periweissella cryptocerci]QBO37501.1 DMT family transporter [Periweissella cryptocerci]